MEVTNKTEAPLPGLLWYPQRKMYPLMLLVERYYPMTKDDRQARSFMLYALVSRAIHLSIWDIDIVPGRRMPHELHHVRIPIRVVARIHGPKKEELWRRGVYNPDYFLKQMNKRLGLQMQWHVDERKEYCEIYNFHVEDGLRDRGDNLVFGVSLSKGYSFIIG